MIRRAVAKEIFRIEGADFFQGFGPVQGKTGRLPGIADIGERSDDEIPDESRSDFRDPDPADIIGLRPGRMQFKGLAPQLNGQVSLKGLGRINRPFQTFKGFFRPFRNIELLGADARPVLVQHFIAVQAGPTDTDWR